MPKQWWIAGVLLGCLGFVAGPAADESAEFVGVSACADCHRPQHEAWKGSHHDQAMQRPGPDTVLGDFSGVSFTHQGIEHRFFRRDQDYFIVTQGDDGTLQTFRVAYTFGAYPLQQYLIRFDDGRYQVPGVAWDSRPRSKGGQRWFHLYPEQNIEPEDPLHWTGSFFNWNSRCASCHSTNLQKNFDPSDNSYDTRWSDINVACEACHGAGSAHVEWARSGAPAASPDKGLQLKLDPVGRWLMKQDKDTAVRHPEWGGGMSDQLNVCGGCHSRRGELGQEAGVEEDFHDRFQLQLITPPLYHRDGQIREEDFVLGSFLQSRMYHQGVVCSDCHEPHSLSLRASGNGVCAQCHKATVFDQPEHHHHPQGEGAQCVSCHMPETTYMVVDPRRDHSIRIPRPDQSVGTDTPNACTGCHLDQTAEWAAEAVQGWTKDRSGRQSAHFSDHFMVAQDDLKRFPEAHLQLLSEEGWPAIIRASSMAKLQLVPDSEALRAAIVQLKDDSALVRSAAVDVVAMLPVSQRRPYLLPLLSDPAGLVRIRVMSALIAVDPKTLSSSQSEAFGAVRREYQRYLDHNADTPEGQMIIATMEVARGDLKAAEKAYLFARKLSPGLPAVAVNLADLYRQMGQDDRGAVVLTEALKRTPDSGELYHALGLLRARQQQYDDAINWLGKAHELQPDNGRWGYIYAVALHSMGEGERAIEVLEQVQRANPGDIDILTALVSYLQRKQDWAGVRRYGEELLQRQPDNAAVADLLRRIPRTR